MSFLRIKKNASKKEKEVGCGLFKLLAAQFERKSMEKVNTRKTSKNEWTLLLIRMLE